MTQPAPTFRIVDLASGQTLRPYQTPAHRDAFVRSQSLKITDCYRDSIALNLFSVYVQPVNA